MKATSYSCPDCEDGTLEAKIRSIALEDGETAQIVDGLVLITRVGCDNGCESGEVAEELTDAQIEQTFEASLRSIGAPAQSRCAKSELCSREGPHRGMCNRNLAVRASVDAT